MEEPKLFHTPSLQKEWRCKPHKSQPSRNESRTFSLSQTRVIYSPLRRPYWTHSLLVGMCYFYVNKHAKQIRGKLRLVINYQDLNNFLANDKFPLPNKSAIFQHLSNAKVFSKFDLKARFWQLGIHPKERYKKAFCIPDHHYQWTVVPFDLKSAPS